MGQQQLLLLVFGVIIVGVAVVAGIQAVADGFGRSEADSIISRNLQIASAAVFWKTKTDPYNGGNASYAGLATNGLARLGMGDSSELGDWAVTAATATTVQITGVGKRDTNIGVRTYISAYSIDSTVVRFDGSLTIP